MSGQHAPALIQLDSNQGVEVQVREPKAVGPGLAFRIVAFMGGLTEAGEALGAFHDIPSPGSDLPLSVEILEADRLPMDADMFLGGSPLTPGEGFHLAGPSGMSIMDPSPAPSLPASAVTQGCTSDEVNAQLRRTFKCRECKQIKAAKGCT